MNKIINWLKDSKYISPLSPACKMCAKGSKMVLLVTGICSSNCFYCPLSLKKLGKDRIFANEWELDDENDTDKLLKESLLIEATGAGITGGDPLLVWKRTKNYISLLKNHFGSDFHIHLYTSGIINGEYIDELVSAGLNEIRFHPNPNFWKNMDKSPIFNTIRLAVNTNVDVAIEIPSFPNFEKETLKLIEWANNIGIKWINLNELEFSETNAKELNSNGFIVKNDISAAVKGSQESAIKIIKKVSKLNYEIGIHYCSSSFKDGIQLKNRIKRRAKNIAKKYDVVSDEGTILKGIISTKKNNLEHFYQSLIKEFKIKENLIFLNKKKRRIEIAPWILEKIAKEIQKRGFECFLIEEYPTADSLIVEKIPLPL